MQRFKDLIEDKAIRNLLLATLAPFVLCVAVYFIRFGGVLHYPISPNQADWGTFGDFVGGVLNPIYAFLAFAGVVYTLLLQKDQINEMKKQQKINEINSLMFGIADRIDKTLYERRFVLRANSPEENFDVFTVLRSISDASLRAELNPDGPDAMVYSTERETIVNRISYDITYIQEQLLLLIWCIDKYASTEETGTLEEFYAGKYRHTVYMMKQIQYLHLDDVDRFFKPDEVKASIVESLRLQGEV